MPLEKKYLDLIASMVDGASEEAAQNRLSMLYELVVSTNEKINITSLTSPIDVSLKHIIDSLALFQSPLFQRAIEAGLKVCDIGCGGGFPGLPIACLSPDTSITMIDSTAKKIRALEENAIALGLKNIIPVAGRGEELAGAKGGQYRERFDLCVSRAVAALPVLCELCLPFVKKGGYFFALKGQKAMEELEQSKKAVPMLGAELTEVLKIHFIVPETLLSEFGQEEQVKINDFISSDRYLIILKKVKNTNPIYPRKWAQMTKKSL